MASREYGNQRGLQPVAGNRLGFDLFERLDGILAVDRALDREYRGAG